MIKNYINFSRFLVLLLIFSSCSDDDNYIPTIEVPVQVSPVNLNLDELPYQTLSEYNFFDGNMANLNPVYGVLPYKIISGLFIDYAQAKTFVWMPEDSNATYINDYTVLDFPTGSVLITTHYFENVLPDLNSKMVETRLLIKMENEWELFNYVWNENQTEASFTTDGSFVPVDWLDNNETRSVNYRIPSYSECFTCHNKYDVVFPIGPKPQNLNHDLSFSDGVQNQLSKWTEFGYLNEGLPSDIVSAVDWSDASQPLELRARSYLDINCSHCHSDEGYCDYRSMRFAFSETDDLSNMGVCVEPDTQIDNSIPYIVAPGYPERSVLFFRISSTLEQNRMPLLGRTLQHEEGVRLIEEWINSLVVTCE